MHELKQMLTVDKTAFIMLVAAAVLAALLILVITYTLASRGFAKCLISDRRKRVLVFLSVFTMLLLIFVAVFAPILYEINYRAAAALPGAKLKTIMSAAAKNTLYFVFAMLLVIGVLFLIINSAKRPRETFFTTKTITRLAVFSALSVVLYFAKFNLPFIFPIFLEIHISDMPALLAGFMMGPQAGAVVIIIRAMIKLPFTSTGGVGELGDLILGLIFVLSSAFIYKRLRTKKGAVIALAVGGACCTAAAVIINRFLLVPFFAILFSWNGILEAMNNIFNGKVTEANFYNYYLPLSALPFNILRCVLSCFTAFLLYRPTKLAFGFAEKKLQKKKNA